MVTYDKRMTGSTRGWAIFAKVLGYHPGQNGYGVRTYQGSGPSFPLSPKLVYNGGVGKVWITVQLRFKWADKWVGVYHEFFNYMGSSRRKGGAVAVKLYVCLLPMLPVQIELCEAHGDSGERWRVWWLSKHRGPVWSPPEGYPELPPMPWQQRLARLGYLARFWTPRWSWFCIMRSGTPGQDVQWERFGQWAEGLQVWPSVVLKGRERWRR